MAYAAAERLTGRLPERTRIARVGRAWRVEIKKLLSQLPVKVLAVVCALAPIAFVALISSQRATPADTLFGRWVHASGFATPLVVLGFAGSWGLPVLTGVVAGDMFSSEDRHGTWKTLLGRSASRGEVFAGKVLAAATTVSILVVLLCASSLLAGVVGVGTQSLVGLSGTVISPGRCLGLVLASWAIVLMPVLAFTSLGVLLSVASRSGIVGVLGLPVIGTTMLLLALVGGGEVARAVMVAAAFDAWHGLFAEPGYLGPVLQAAGVSIAYVVVCLGAAWAILRRRDFAGTSSGTTVRTLLSPRPIAIAVAVVAALGVASAVGPTGITASRLDTAINYTFDNLTTLQQELLGRVVPAGRSLSSLANCSRRGGGARTSGPGDDWSCTITIVVPPPRPDTIDVHYDVTVRANGCYTTAGPETFLGQRLLPGKNGAVNPLFEFDGCFDTT